MKKIQIGNEFKNGDYEYRETCFGIYEKDNKLYLTEKNNEISLIGGGIEKNESYFDCLRREFLEESGCMVKKSQELYIIDCCWVTRNNVNMRSVAHIFLVDIEDNILEPLEKKSRLVIINKDMVLEKLELPYQIKAIEMYLKANEL